MLASECASHHSTYLPFKLYQRILVAYILYSLYAPYPMVINPFNSVLYKAFVSERDQALKIAGGGGPVENLQLVWVLWKILKGDGSDVRDNVLSRASSLKANRLALNLQTLWHDHRCHQNSNSQIFSWTARHIRWTSTIYRCIPLALVTLRQ